MGQFPWSRGRIDDHDGCSRAADGSEQLVLRLMQNSSCSPHDQQQSAVRLQGHPVESFEAFSKLSLRLYRGPDAVPQARAGKASTAAASDKTSGNSSATAVAETAGLHSSLPDTAATDVEYGDSDSLVWGWMWQVTAFVKDQFNLSSRKARLLADSDGEAVPQLVQLSSASTEIYPNSTHSRHLLSGTGCLAGVHILHKANVTSIKSSVDSSIVVVCSYSMMLCTSLDESCLLDSEQDFAKYNVGYVFNAALCWMQAAVQHA